MKINGDDLDIKTFLKLDPAVGEDLSSQVVGKIYRIELRMPDGTNYLHLRQFADDAGMLEAEQLLQKMKEKGELNMDFWKEGDPV